ncbi:hypothetical protein Dip518_001397 [Parelusimicrobium proximum]|uniref:lysophospholipid acyltransferase family protein n=1 Tax=Parelusimicrobium proximum TaxID=3228953 RepID=UPI003D16378F
MSKRKMLKTSIKSPHSTWKHGVVSNLIYAYSMFLGWTTKIRYFLTDEARKMDAEGQNYIFGIWHNQQAFLLYPYRNQKVCSLISLSKDGEYIARVLPKFGMKAVRGSTSKGGYSALRALIDISQAGYHPMLTPDGPRGPVYKVHPGILFLAMKTGLPIMPVGCGLSNKFTVGSWDRMRIPLPFGRCALVYGRAIYVNEDTDFEEAKHMLEKQLNEVTMRAEQMVIDPEEFKKGDKKLNVNYK